jgi:hypothetical protein
MSETISIALKNYANALARALARQYDADMEQVSDSDRESLATYFKALPDHEQRAMVGLSHIVICSRYANSDACTKLAQAIANCTRRKADPR